MTLTVVIPTWNRADLLPETLDTVLAQSAPADEIIVVDDGSEDDTPAILARYAHHGVRAIRTPNAGDLAARNVGLRAARGDRVAFLDSDDLWHPDYLAAMSALWVASPGLQAAYADFLIVRDGAWEETTKFDAAPTGFWRGLRTLPGEGLHLFDAPIVERLLAYQPFFPSALVADRAFLLSIGGWDEGTAGLIGRDFATALRIAEHWPIGILRRPLVGIRKHATNDSRDTLEMNLGDAAVLDHVRLTRPALARYDTAFRASAASRRRAALDAAFARGRYADVRRISASLPAGRDGALRRLKRVVSALPDPGRAILGRILSAAGTLKSRLGTPTP